MSSKSFFKEKDLLPEFLLLQKHAYFYFWQQFNLKNKCVTPNFQIQGLLNIKETFSSIFT